MILVEFRHPDKFGWQLNINGFHSDTVSQFSLCSVQTIIIEV